jgi:PIN domain nuclease of toxin-antitoxin system
MRLLLDAHAFLWFLEGSEQLSAPARGVIEDPANEILVSVATLWEIAIKHSLGRLELQKPFAELIPEQLTTNGFELLPVELSHISKVAALPFHHRDPFDRLIIAQALVEEMPIVGRDAEFDRYAVKRLW